MPDHVTSDGKAVAFHVGVHKTGTTMLQNFLWDRQAELRRKRVDLIGRFEMARDVGWGLALVADPGPFARRIDEFRQSAETDLLLISHEEVLGHIFPAGGDGSLYQHVRRNMAAVARFLAPLPTRIVIVLRPQDEFLESYYLQTLHSGGTETFEEWLANADLDALSWRPVVTALTDTFGADAVTVLDFRAIRDGQAQFIRRYLLALDERLDLDPDYPVAHNRSLSDKAMRIALGVNPLLRKRTDRLAFRDFLQLHFSNANYPRARLFGDAQKQLLRDRYAAEYEELVGAPAQAGPGATPSTKHP